MGGDEIFVERHPQSGGGRNGRMRKPRPVVTEITARTRSARAPMGLALDIPLVRSCISIGTSTTR